MTQKEYNGWTNYETWVVKLWMDNEQDTYSFWRVAAKTALLEAEANGPFSKEDQAILDLSDALKANHEEGSEDFMEAGENECGERSRVFKDLLRAALCEVNWHEIATNLIERELAEPAA